MTDADRAECMDADMREWFEALTPERRAVITARMSKQIVDTVGEWNDDTDPVLVETTFFEVAGLMYTQSLFDGLLEEGKIVVSSIGDDGEYRYSLADTNE